MGAIDKWTYSDLGEAIDPLRNSTGEDFEKKFDDLIQLLLTDREKSLLLLSELEKNYSNAEKLVALWQAHGELLPETYEEFKERSLREANVDPHIIKGLGVNREAKIARRSSIIQKIKAVLKSSGAH